MMRVGLGLVSAIGCCDPCLPRSVVSIGEVLVWLYLGGCEDLHDLEVGLWCPLTSKSIIVPLFSKETIRSERYVNSILRQFF
jgi:hypothetical protein